MLMGQVGPYERILYKQITDLRAGVLFDLNQISNMNEEELSQT